MRRQHRFQSLLITGLGLAAITWSSNAQSASIQSGAGKTNELTPAQERMILDDVARRLHADAQAVLQLSTNGTVSAAVEKKVAGELKRIEEEIPRLPQSYSENFRAILPLNALHERIFQAQAAIWRSSGARGLVAWQTGAWDPLQLIHPIPSKTGAVVSVAMMNNEFRAGAFNLSNAGEKDATVTLKISGLPSGENPSWITVHEVAWTDTKSGKPIADALPEAKRERHGFVLHIPSGMTRQVWFTFHPTNVPAGQYQGHVVISGRKRIEIPLNLRVYPMRLPDHLALHVGGWDYTDQPLNWGITPENRALVVAHLKEHFVDSPWAHSVVLPTGEFGPDDQFIQKPDTANFDDWLGRWPDATRYCVFMDVQDNLAGAQMGTPLFEKRVGNWIQFWAQHARERGLKAEQLFLLLSDEPHRASADALILAWAKAIHAAHTGVKIWEDPIHTDPAIANQAMLAECDILCPNRVKFLQNRKVHDYFTSHRPSGPELAFYSCSGPMTLLDPYSYVRLQAWSAWLYGAQTSYFWSFSDSGRGSSWNEYSTTRANYDPFFLDKTSVTPAKQMEALRESAEDYQYLVMLRETVANAEKQGVRGAKLEQAQKLLTEAAPRVCNASGATALGWATPKNRGVADEVRVEILDALSELQNAGK